MVRAGVTTPQDCRLISRPLIYARRPQPAADFIAFTLMAHESRAAR